MSARVFSISFGDLENFPLLSFQYTIAHGVSPGRMIVRLGGIDAKPSSLISNMVISDGVTSIEFANTRLVDGTYQVDTSGNSATMAFEDRRHEWLHRIIDGEYNIPAPRISPVPPLPPPGWNQGNRPEPIQNVFPNSFIPQIEEWSRKSVRDLAKLLIVAMKESDINLNDLPDDQYPYINWIGANPAEELELLCLQYACRLMWNHQTNRPFIGKTGDGELLPEFSPTEFAQDIIVIDPPEPPDEFVVYGAPARYQIRMDTEPVGLDLDGRWRHISWLAYRPSVLGWFGWPSPFPETLFADIPIRLPKYKMEDAWNLADLYVYKAYRIKKSVTVTRDVPTESTGKFERVFEIPGTVGAANDEKKLLYTRPEVILTGFTNEVSIDFTGVPFLQAIRAYGMSIAAGLKGERTDRFDQIHIPIVQIIPEHGIVVFAEPLQFHTTLARVNIINPGKLQVIDHQGVVGVLGNRNQNQVFWFPTNPVIECAVMVRDKDTHQVKRWTHKFRSNSQRTGWSFRTQKPIFAPDIQRFHITEYDNEHNDKGFVHNTPEAIAHARYYMQAEQSKYQWRTPQERRYNGIKDIALDGAIMEVTWVISTSGAFTHAARNNESGVWIDPYAFRIARKVVDLEAIARENQERAARQRRMWEDKQQRVRAAALAIYTGKLP